MDYYSKMKISGIQLYIATYTTVIKIIWSKRKQK